MILEELTIRRNQNYDPNPTGYKGQIRFKGQYGAIELALNHEVSSQILAIVGANAVETTRQIAQNLSADVFNVPAIEEKPESLPHA